MPLTEAGAILAGSALTSLFGAGSAGMGLMANNASQLRQYEYNKLLQKQQAKLNYDYSKKLNQYNNTWNAQYMPAWSRSGLEFAGYNPMLAVQNGTTGGNALSAGSFSSGNSVNAQDNAGAINAGIGNALDVMRLKNEFNQASSVINSNNANARKTTAEAQAQEMENPYIPERMRTELNKMHADITYLDTQSEYIRALQENIPMENWLKQYGIEMDYKGKVYNADSISGAMRYSADKGLKGVKYHSKTLKNIANKHSPSGKSESFKNYMFGVGAGVGAAGSLYFPVSSLLRSPVGFR